ncbi:MAG: lipoyl(octanoyl) transferase LipB [Pseudomonadales bacterium]|nr:lipoyl(octanoyl) transferase LipB [Pseudomonadales bacterium]
MKETEDYFPIWQRMRTFTHARTANTMDECWMMQHNAVYTLGQAGRPEHILEAPDVPVIKSDRGGQVTFHGPGQLVVYPLIDLRRKKLGIRELVTRYESIVIDVLDSLDLKAYARKDAPGVYVHCQGQEHKIAALGLRVHKGCAYHGFCLNVAMDAAPFDRINPCGYAGMKVCSVADLVGNVSFEVVQDMILQCLVKHLQYSVVEYAG